MTDALLSVNTTTVGSDDATHVRHKPLPRHLHGRVTAKDRREKMLVALRAAGLRRRPRRN